MKCSTVELLEVMLEETDPSSSELARKIYAQLSFKNLLTTMVQVWNCYNKSTCKTDKSFWRNGLLRCYHTIKMIAYYTGAKPDAMGMSSISYLSREYMTEFFYAFMQSRINSDMCLVGKTVMWRQCCSSAESGPTALRLSTSQKEYSLECIFLILQRSVNKA